MRANIENNEAVLSAVVSREAVEVFLYEEAALLDAGQLKDWLMLLADDIDYRIPVRITRDRTAGPPQFSDAAFHMQEDMPSLRARVFRFDSPSAYSVNPPSRCRRFVTNVRILKVDNEGTWVSSNILLYRALADAPSDILCGERRDLLTCIEGKLKLRKRLVLLEHTYLPTENLSAFL